MATNIWIELPATSGSGGVTSLNGLTGAISLVAGSGITITPGIGIITISAIDPTGTPNKFAGYDGSGNLNPIPAWNINAYGGADVNQALAPTDSGSTFSYVLNQEAAVITPTNDLPNTFVYGHITTFELDGAFDYNGFTGHEQAITQGGNSDITADLVNFFPRIQLGVDGAGTSQTTRSIYASIRESGTHQANSLRAIEASISIDGGAFSQESTSYQGSTYVGGSGDFAYGLNQAVQVDGTLNQVLFGLNIAITSIFPGASVENSFGINTSYTGDVVVNSTDLNIYHNGVIGQDSNNIAIYHEGLISNNSTGIAYTRNGATTGGFNLISANLNSSSSIGTDFRWLNLFSEAPIANDAAGILINQNGNIVRNWTGFGNYINCDIGNGSATVFGSDFQVYPGHTINAGLFGYNFINQSTALRGVAGLNFNNQGDYTGNLAGVSVFNGGNMSGNNNAYGLQVQNSGTGYRFQGCSISNSGDFTEEIRGLLFNSTANARTQTGVDISMSGSTTDDGQGLRVNVNNLTTSSTDQHIHSASFEGGCFSVSGGFSPFNGVGVDIGNGFSIVSTINSGSPLTGTDQIIQLIQSNLQADDDIATGPFGLDTNMVGVVSQLSLGSGKTIPLLRSLLVGTSVPTGSGGTVTEHVVIEVLGLPSFGGSVTCPTKIGIQDSTLLGQSFSDGATDAWFIKNQDPNTENHLSKLAINTASKKVSSGVIGLEVDASKNTWLANTTIGGATYIAPVTNAVLLLNEGHLQSIQSTPPTISPNAAAGTGATASLARATDIAGEITINTGTLGVSTGSYATITFNEAYSIAPIIVITPASGTLSTSVYVTASTTTFSINFAVAGGISSTYKLNYHVIETQ